MKNVFGKLTPYNTVIHRLDPRIKMLALIGFMAICFLPYGNYANRFIILGILFAIILVLMAIAKCSFLSFLSNLKSLWFMMIFLLIIFVFVPQTGDTSSYHPIITFPNGYQIYYEGLFQSLHVFFRLVMMIALTLILTSTTPPMEMTYALEWFLTPLRIIKFPTQVISMTISLALRFIPTLLDEANKIMKAQQSRGVDYEKGFLTKKIKSVTTLIVPLLSSCFSRSDELSLAMNARGYEPYGKRSSYRVLKIGRNDIMALIIVFMIVAAFSTMCYFTQNVAGYDNFLHLWFDIGAF